MTATSISLPSDVHGYGLLSARPAAGLAGRHYYATDNGVTYRDNGASWDALPAGGGLTVEEVDGSPTDNAITKIVMPNGTLAIAAHVATYTPAGGSGGGSSDDNKPSIHKQPTSPSANNDEFDDRSGSSGPINGLNARWSRHNVAGARLRLDDAYAPGALLFGLPTGEATDQSIYMALPSGDFDLTVRFFLDYYTDRQMWSAFIVSTTGAGIGVVADPSAADQLRDLSAWAQTGSTTALATGSKGGNAIINGIPMVMVLRRFAGAYSGSITTGDRITTAGMVMTARTPTAFTAAYAGFGRIFGTGASRCVVDYIRTQPYAPPLEPEDTIALHGTYGDEFNAGTLDARWTRRNTAAVTSMTGADAALSFPAQGDGILQPWTDPAADFEIIVRIDGLSDGGGMTGIVVVDASGNGIGYSPYNDGNTYLWGVTGYNYSGTGASNGSQPTLAGTYYLALRRVSGNFNGRWKNAGGVWSGWTGNGTAAGTLNRIGYHRIYTSGGSITTAIGRFNYFTPSSGL